MCKESTILRAICNINFFDSSLSFSLWERKQNNELPLITDSQNLSLFLETSEIESARVSIDWLIHQTLEMVRKKVPEWLNSTMWSTPPPPSSYDDGLLRHSPVTKMKEEAQSVSVAPRLNSAPPPSSTASVPSPSHRPRNGSSISGGSGEYGNSVGPSAEDFSRQAHVSAEVNATFLFCFINTKFSNSSSSVLSSNCSVS